MALHRQQGDERGQKGEREDHRRDHADSDDVPQLPERWRDRKVQREETDCSGDTGNGNLAHVFFECAPRPFFTVWRLDHGLPNRC